MLGIDLSAFTVLISTLMQLTLPAAPDSPHMEDVFCVAINAYHEARGEDFNELLAVSQVVMNRVDDPSYPDTACEVIMQGPTRPSWSDPEVLVPRKYACQFTWWCDGRSDKVHDAAAWRDCTIAAYLVYIGAVSNQVGDATHYFAHEKVIPKWAASMHVVTVFNGHTYLRRM
tara:strand:- start:38 stop:553 length:516 start_codon:yes stop_codon:yes gene_type:complete